MKRSSTGWDQLIEQLSAGDLDRAEITEMVSLVSKVIDVGDGDAPPWLRGFPKGIPRPDGIVIHAVVQRDQLRGLVDLLTTSSRIDSLRVFPRGIINPEVFLTEIEMR